MNAPVDTQRAPARTAHEVLVEDVARTLEGSLRLRTCALVLREVAPLFGSRRIAAYDAIVADVEVCRVPDGGDCRDEIAAALRCLRDRDTWGAAEVLLIHSDEPSVEAYVLACAAEQGVEVSR